MPDDPASSTKKAPALPVKAILFVVVVVLFLCGCQFLLLERHFDSPGPPVHSNLDSVHLEALLARYSSQEANISVLASQQIDLAGITAKLGDALRREHEELMGVESRLASVLAGSSGAAAVVPPDLLAASVAQKRQLSDLGAEIQRLSAAQAKNTAHAVDAATSIATPVSGKPAVLDDFPAEWLEHFSKEELQASALEADKWLKGTKAAFEHAWNGYRSHAWGKDEMKPSSGAEARHWGNMGLTLLDSLSTIWIMDLKKEFDEAEKWVQEHLRFDQGQGMVSFFEITIRALGGLVAAHSLSGRPVFLEKAKQLADIMVNGFNNDNGFPNTQIDLKTGRSSGGWYGGTVLAEAGTVQLEFRYISQMTGDKRYQDKADKSMRSIAEAGSGRGLIPWGLNKNGPPHFQNTHITFGAMGDSYYEYLLKMYVQTSKTEPEWKDSWKQSMDEMFQKLIFKTKGGLTYVAEEKDGRADHKMDHLACFVGGMLIYGARELPKSEVKANWEQAGAGITETCFQMYHRYPSHLAPEASRFVQNGDTNNDMFVWNNNAHYLLRPEAAEAIFYMFYYTGDPKYRRMAGEIYEAIEKHCKTTYGYSAVNDVRQPNPSQKNEMESFFLAETLKYLYLTFLPNPRAVLSLDEFVFNTEAHPIRIFKPGQPGFMSKK